MRRFIAGLLAVLAILAGPDRPATAATGAWVDVDLGPGVVVSMRLLAAVDAAGSLDSIPAGLHVVLPDGWKTYWRTPGDAGLPPSLDATASSNVAGHALRYPVPHRFTLFGFETFGYDTEVVFPLDIAVARPGEPVRTDLTANLLVCSDICVPAIGQLVLDLPAGPAEPDARSANLINRFASQVPDDGTASGITLTRVATGEAMVDGTAVPALLVEAVSREPLTAPDVFVEFQPFWAFGAPAVTLDDGGRHLVATIPASQQPSDAGPLDGEAVVLTIADGLRAAEFAATIGAPVGTPVAPGAAVPTPPIAGTGGTGLLVSILITAFLGGLVLNLMPCVLPVLSIKLFGVISQGGAAPATIRRGFLASAAGIVVSFLLLAGAAILVKVLGGTVAWGIQFQQPLFLIFMVLVLSVFTANMLGFFEIALPGSLADRAARVGGSGSFRGHFATGMMATLLATPCSAPFVGTALGFAFARGPAEIAGIFAVMGLGLAAPYLLVAAAPRLAARLPRPGTWMVWVKRVLALALAATAIWLLDVLAAQLSATAALALAALMVVLIVALGLRRGSAGAVRPALAGAVGLLAIAAFLLPSVLPRNAATAAGPSHWVAFDEAAIATRVASGEVVLVDVTADWCLTCIANKTLVLEVEPVAGLLAEGVAVPMQADWTLPDDAIADFLARHGRYGIPFNVVYGPQAPDGIVLPELLSRSAVLDALIAAGLDPSQISRPRG